MNTATDVVLISALAALWLTAGLLADGLPGAGTARDLRRRARTLSTVVGAGAVVLISVPLLSSTSAVPAAALLPAVPGTVVLLMTVRRLARIRRGAGAFATAPLTPVPPALRAAAAHPLVATPLQVTGLAALAGVPIAAGIIEVPGAEVAGIVLTVIGIAVLALGVRHAVRHSRLNLAVLAPLSSGRMRGLPLMPTPVANYQARQLPAVVAAIETERAAVDLAA